VVCDRVWEQVRTQARRSQLLPRPCYLRRLRYITQGKWQESYICISVDEYVWDFVQYVTKNRSANTMYQYRNEEEGRQIYESLHRGRYCQVNVNLGARAKTSRRKKIVNIVRAAEQEESQSRTR